jgi:hypothetical protein
MKIFKWLFSKKNDDNKVAGSHNNNLEITKEQIENEAICPYCKTGLKKFPLRKTKCPHCENFIFIRKLADSKSKTLITEEQAQEIDIEREKDYLKYRGFHNLETFGVTKDEFIMRKEEHYLKYGIENNNNDVVWSLFDELLIKNANDVDKLRMIYYAMAVLLHQEGKDNFRLLQLSAKATLDSYQHSDLALNFQIIGSKDSCENCKKMDGKIISMEEAYLLPVPCRECTHSIGFCRCTYGAVSIRDNEGMLILKK